MGHQPTDGEEEDESKSGCRSVLVEDPWRMNIRKISQSLRVIVG